MYSINVPRIKKLQGNKNAIGLAKNDYAGAVSTLCGGCGHDSITAALIQACFELAIPPYRVAKLSGIGCSSKTPAYFLSQAHGFNSVHGRMPSVATGAYAADRHLYYLAVSGDGDTGSIGFGQFCHIIRRQVNMLYIVENNGVYGLTKGQFSATADIGSKTKKGEVNDFPPIDPAILAIQLGASFVGRSFSGNKKQLVPLIKAAMLHKGFSFLDVLSPCVSFNNHEGSTKSYDFIREHEKTYAEVSDYVPKRQAIELDTDQKEFSISLHDGTDIIFSDVDGSYNPSDKLAALTYLSKSECDGKIATGLLYYIPTPREFHDIVHTSQTSLRDIPYSTLCPGSAVLKDINNSLR